MIINIEDLTEEMRVEFKGHNSFVTRSEIEMYKALNEIRNKKFNKKQENKIKLRENLLTLH